MVIDKTIFQTNAPSHSDVIWAKPEEDKITLHMYNRGKWMPVSGGGSSEDNTQNKTSNIDGRLLIQLPDTFVHNGHEYTWSNFIEDNNKTPFIDAVGEYILAYTDDNDIDTDTVAFTYTYQGKTYEARHLSDFDTGTSITDGTYIWGNGYKFNNVVPMLYRYQTEDIYFTNRPTQTRIGDVLTGKVIPHKDVAAITNILYCPKFVINNIYFDGIIFTLKQIDHPDLIGIEGDGNFEVYSTWAGVLPEHPADGYGYDGSNWVGFTLNAFYGDDQMVMTSNVLYVEK